MQCTGMTEMIIDKALTECEVKPLLPAVMRAIRSSTLPI